VDCEIKKDFCVEFDQPCRNGADCVSEDSSFFYRCICPTGYNGDRCDTEIDECASDPCLHGGRCEDLLGAHRCDCAGTGFEGEVCEINIDECLRDPCVNGECKDTDGSFVCECAPGYCGTTCPRMNPCLLVRRRFFEMRLNK
jgi:protein crumbs